MGIDVEDSSPSAFGKFEVIKQIGHGGMATVDRAYLRGMGGFKREVVLKRILPDLAKDDHFIKMFVEEAKLSAMLEHPNIVQVYDFGAIDNMYYISMEYINGRTLLQLKKYMRKRGPFPIGLAAFIIQEMCNGLHYTHTLTRGSKPLGLVHRDISPSNVMVSTHGQVKLLDFGIAKAVEAIDDEHTRTGTLKGKWSYMAPEQVVGKPLTARSDIFATGIVMWEILTGRRLFKDKTDFLTLSNVAQAKVPPIRSIRDEIPPSLEEVCHRALSLDPNDRFQTAEEMADHLDEYLIANPIPSSKLAELICETRSQATETSTPELVRPGEDEEDTKEEMREAIEESLGSMSESLASVSEAVEHSESRSGQKSYTSVAGEKESRPAIRPWWPVPAAIGGGVTLVVIIAAVLLLRQSDDPPPARVGVHGPTPAKAPAAQVDLSIVSSPTGARVHVIGEDQPRGVTPMTINMLRSSDPIRLELTLKGHDPKMESVIPSEDRKVSFELRRVEIKAPTPPRRPGPDAAIHPAPPPAAEKPRAAVPKEAAKPDAKPGETSAPPVKKPAAKPEPTKPTAARRDPADKPGASKPRAPGSAAPEGKAPKAPKPPAKPPRKKLPDLKSGDLTDPFK